MEVNNSKVHDYIQEALDNNAHGALVYRLDGAFMEVNARRSIECENIDLAAADHYLISRWLIVRCSPLIATVYAGMITGYDGVYKAADEIFKKISKGSSIVFRTGNCAPTPFSPFVIAWALTGVSDGIVDCLRLKWEDSPEVTAPYTPTGYISRAFRK